MELFYSRKYLACKWVLLAWAAGKHWSKWEYTVSWLPDTTYANTKTLPVHRCIRVLEKDPHFDHGCHLNDEPLWWIRIYFFRNEHTRKSILIALCEAFSSVGITEYERFFLNVKSHNTNCSTFNSHWYQFSEQQIHSNNFRIFPSRIMSYFHA